MSDFNTLMEEERIYMQNRDAEYKQYFADLEAEIDAVSGQDAIDKLALRIAGYDSSISMAEKTGYPRLLEKGANIDAVDEEGNTALMKAAFYKLKLTKFLIENGANPNLKNLEGETALDIAPASYEELKEILASANDVWAYKIGHFRNSMLSQ
jgi:hypothetical protein